MRLALPALVALAALSACKPKELRYEHVVLPGFSLDLPRSPDRTGLGAVESRTLYAAGSIKRGQSRDPMHLVAISWQPGLLSTEEEIVDLVEIMAKSMSEMPVQARVAGKPRLDTIGDQRAIRVGFTIDRMQLELVEVVCGARAIQIVAGAADPAPILERMLGSFRCAPDPAREAELDPDRSPVGFNGLTGWERMDMEGAGFGISDGTTLAFFAPVADMRAVDRLGFDKILASMLEVSFGAWRPADTLHAVRHGVSRDIAFGRTTSDGQEAFLGATIWKCPHGPAIFAFALDLGAESEAAARDAAVDVLTRARCLDPGESAPRFPLAAEGADLGGVE